MSNEADSNTENRIPECGFAHISKLERYYLKPFYTYTLVL